MKLELKEFQITRRRELHDELVAATEEFARRGKQQAIVFSSPTGSGKTITIAGLLEDLLKGTEGYPARPQMRFLWISDSPELNAQSRNKLLHACDAPAEVADFELISSEAFKEEELAPGRVYFINTQLLGKDKRLTGARGDTGGVTFWQTVANTVRRHGSDLLLIIDEAHKGMGISAKERNKGLSIIRKFIQGSPEDGLPPVPLVLGMSATTQRFDAFLSEAQQERTVRKVTIRAEEVRSSGLLKDQMVVIMPETKVNTDMTLLELAARRWKEFEKTWDEYSAKEGEASIRPVLVVQVEDGRTEGDVLSKTPLDEVIEVLRRTVGSFKQGAIVHCFEGGDLVLGGENVRKIEQSRIQDDGAARIVLFKTALSTGWDCPRAEVMMSFRKAVDHTFIAQLVGRMIRTPLARRITTYEMLNTVELYLPHYDRENLAAILKELREPNEEDRPATEVTTEQPVSYERNPACAKAFEVLTKIQTAVFSNPMQLSSVRKLMRMAFYLAGDKIDEDAYERERKEIVDILLRHRTARWKDEADWATVVRETGEVGLEQFVIGIGKMELPEAALKVRAELAPENVEGLFKEAQRRIGPGTDIHMAFWKEAEKHTDPLLAKLELYALSGDAAVLKELSDHAEKRFAALESAHRSAVRDLKAKRNDQYRKLQQAGRNHTYLDWQLPEQILEKPGGDFFEHHLYCNADGQYQAVLNRWEKRVLGVWMKRKDFVGWLRNPPSKERSFCVPYEHGGWKRAFPDLVVVRREGKTFAVDVLEPHRTNEDDTFAKAKGLAQFAEDYGVSFGRLMMLKVEGEGEKAIVLGFDVNESGTRKKALMLRNNEMVQGLFHPLTG